MTDNVMDLRALPGTSADADFLREMIGFAAQRLMVLEVGGPTGAGYGEKALTAVIPEAYSQGISTRSVDDLVKAMGMRASRRARSAGFAKRSTFA